jgi:hypothetical protein
MAAVAARRWRRRIDAHAFDVWVMGGLKTTELIQQLMEV